MTLEPASQSMEEEGEGKQLGSSVVSLAPGLSQCSVARSLRTEFDPAGGKHAKDGRRKTMEAKTLTGEETGRNDKKGSEKIEEKRKK